MWNATRSSIGFDVLLIMLRDIISIVEEYMRSAEPQLRRNAITALAAINSAESISGLVRVTLSDGDEPVVQHAVAELLKLKEESLARAVGELILALEKPLEQQRAYYILGMLYGAGVKVTLPKQRLSVRLRLDASQRSAHWQARKWKERIRAWKPALYGYLGGMMALVSIVSISIGLNWDSFLPALALCAILGALVAIFSTQGTKPIGHQIDRVASLAVEFGSAACGAFVFVPVFVVLAPLFNLSFFGRHTWNWKALAMMGTWALGLGIFVGVMRIGTALTYGSMRTRRGNQLAQCVIGGMCGMSMVTAVALINMRQGVSGPFWPLLFPIAFGVSNAFAAIDSECETRRAVYGKGVRLLCCGIAAAFVLVIGWKVVKNVGHFKSGPEWQEAFSRLWF
jgi:hypothetical protein